jgi:hypothetical protein
MEIVGALARNRDRARLRRMPELTMTPALPVEAPSVLMQEAEDTAHLHVVGLATPTRLGQMSISGQ